MNLYKNHEYFSEAEAYRAIKICRIVFRHRYKIAQERPCTPFLGILLKAIKRRLKQGSNVSIWDELSGFRAEHSWSYQDSCSSASVRSNILQPCGLKPLKLLCPWDSPGKDTSVGCYTVFQGILPTEGSNLASPTLAGNFWEACTFWLFKHINIHLHILTIWTTVWNLILESNILNLHYMVNFSKLECSGRNCCIPKLSRSVQFSSVQLLSRVRISATPWIAAG